jgi:hypothetical protein
LFSFVLFTRGTCPCANCDCRFLFERRHGKLEAQQLAAQGEFLHFYFISPHRALHQLFRKAESQRHYEMLERARAALAEERQRCQNVLLKIAAFEAERENLQQEIACKPRASTESHAHTLAHIHRFWCCRGLWFLARSDLPSAN